MLFNSSWSPDFWAHERMCSTSCRFPMRWAIWKALARLPVRTCTSIRQRSSWMKRMSWLAAEGSACSSAFSMIQMFTTFETRLSHSTGGSLGMALRKRTTGAMEPLGERASVVAIWLDARTQSSTAGRSRNSITRWARSKWPATIRRSATSHCEGRGPKRSQLCGISVGMASHTAIWSFTISRLRRMSPSATSGGPLVPSAAVLPSPAIPAPSGPAPASVLTSP
mmetsp:Transcript_57637/g.181054  ORF Transcript_57637/g.181054 Transcript_57637/m.181054 type:complete len:224 (-) Transcript_57637:2-673(-)